MLNEIDIILATKHKKELAIQGLFEAAFKARIFVPEDYDTDQFGTFTGEIPRLGSAQECVINKAKKACEEYNFQYGIANEGSFGPHPHMFFIPGDVELISFVDIKNDLIVVESEISTDTNFSVTDINHQSDYSEFLQKMKFGTHGLIVRGMSENTIIEKGVCDYGKLKKLLKTGFKKNEIIRLETDMRAMMNPTRMKVIHAAAKKLVKRLKSHCKVCNTPGFGKTSVMGKLLCSLCGIETELYQYIVKQCIKCDYQEHDERPDKLVESDPQHCHLCNP